MLSVLVLAGTVLPAGAQSLALATASGGATITGTNPSWSTGFGVVNGLGIGPPSAGVSVISTGVTGGVLYTTPFTMVLSGISQGVGLQADVRAHVSTGFAHPTALELRVCYPAASCTTAAAYTPLSALASTPTPLTPANSSNGSYSASLGLFVSQFNGPGALAGSDTATITLRLFRTNQNTVWDTDTLALNNPSVTAQTALRLLIEAAGGAAISAGPTFTTSFGTVNGLGIGPASGVSATALPDGALYATPYALRPTFAGFTSSTGTVRAHVSVDFAHPLVLELRHSLDNSTFAALSKVAGAPTTVAASAASGTVLTRHLGLFVSSLNGVGAFTGADFAVVTFTLVIQ